MRVAVWATTFQADVQTLAYALAADPRFEVVVVMDDPEGYAHEEIARLRRFPGTLLKKGAWSTRRKLMKFAPDVLVVDNHLPTFRAAPRILVQWHGFGWRTDDLSTMRTQLAQQVGDVTRPNSAFRWLAFGDWDRQYRINHSMIDGENVVAVGSPYSDVLLPYGSLRPTFMNADVQGGYTIDIESKKTVLLGLTWHHGGAFEQWGSDEQLLAQLCEHVGAHGANLLIRMHDRKRYERRTVRKLREIVHAFPHVMLKFKDEFPDSTIDLLVSDVMISNYSSFLNAFYYTGRPSIHVDPVEPNASAAVYRRLRFGRIRKERVPNPAALWKLDRRENGGLTAQSFDELLAQVAFALANPTCCAERTAAFVAKYITQADGRTSERVRDLILAWATT